jgi:hypothetical protein
MESNHKKQALAFGELIATIYHVCGRQNAEGIVRLAINAHLLEFGG